MNNLTVSAPIEAINILEPCVQSHVAAETLQVRLTTTITTCASTPLLAGQRCCVVVAGVTTADKVGDLLVSKGCDSCTQVHGTEVWHQVPTEAVLPVVVGRVALRIYRHSKFKLGAADHCCVAVTPLLTNFNYVEHRPPVIKVCECIWRCNNKLEACG